jgi:hypothetical protein
LPLVFTIEKLALLKTGSALVAEFASWHVWFCRECESESEENGSLSSEQAGHPAINLWEGKNRHDQRLFEKYLIIEFQRLHPDIAMKNRHDQRLFEKHPIIEFQRLHPDIAMKNKNNGGGGVAGLRLKDEHGKWATLVAPPFFLPTFSSTCLLLM